MKKHLLLLTGISLLAISSCGNTLDSSLKDSNDSSSYSSERLETKMKLNVNNVTLEANLENNRTTEALMNMMKEAPISIQFSDYGGFEKVGSLGKTLPNDDEEIVTGPGDIVLYNGSNIVIFYGSNSWSYTRIGKMTDISNLKKILGSGSLTITLSL